MPSIGTTSLLILMIISYLHYYFELKLSHSMRIKAWKMNNQGENIRCNQADCVRKEEISFSKT